MISSGLSRSSTSNRLLFPLALRPADGNFDGKYGLVRTILSIDEAARTVRLSAAYEHPDRLVANAMGSVEKLPNGNVLVGWGEEPCASEFASSRMLPLSTCLILPTSEVQAAS